MVVASGLPSHVKPRDATHSLRIVLVLHPHPLTERGVKEGSRIARGKDVGCRRSCELINNDAVVHVQARPFSEIYVGLDADAGDNSIDFQGSLRGRLATDADPELIGLPFNCRYCRLWQDLDALLPVVSVEEVGDVFGKNVGADSRAWKDHHDVLSVKR